MFLYPCLYFCNLYVNKNLWKFITHPWFQLDFRIFLFFNWTIIQIHEVGLKIWKWDYMIESPINLFIYLFYWCNCCTFFSITFIYFMSGRFWNLIFFFFLEWLYFFGLRLRGFGIIDSYKLFFFLIDNVFFFFFVLVTISNI